jgi:hypothetical protein
LKVERRAAHRIRTPAVYRLPATFSSVGVPTHAAKEQDRAGQFLGP